MISVIIPVYNVAKYLRKCLDSVVNQTYRDLEILLINDGSTDNSEKICLEYATQDKRIIYVRKKNEGLGTVRNLGISMAQGEYFTAIDSDDWWSRDYCQKMYNTMEQFKADIVLCDFANVYLSGDAILSETPSRMRIQPNKVQNAFENPSLINTCRTIFCAKLYRTDFLRTCQMIQPGYAYEDMATTPLLTALAKRIVRIPEVLYFYVRNRAESTTNQPTGRPNLKLALELMVKRFQERGLFQVFERELLKKNHSDVRFLLNRMKNPAEQASRETIKKELCTFLSATYPKWVNVDVHSFTVVGSEFLHQAICRFLFDPERAIYFPELRDALQYPDTLQSDYLVTDIPEAVSLLPDAPNTKLYLVGFGSQDFLKKFLSVVTVKIPKNSEDEDCACWDLSDAIFFSL